MRRIELHTYNIANICIQLCGVPVFWLPHGWSLETSVAGNIPLRDWRRIDKHPICIYICTYVCMYAYVCVNVCASVCVFIFIYIHIHKSKVLIHSHLLPLSPTRSCLLDRGDRLAWTFASGKPFNLETHQQRSLAIYISKVSTLNKHTNRQMFLCILEIHRDKLL